MVQILDERNIKDDEKIDIAFRYDSDDLKSKDGMRLFNEYACGGIMWMYNEIISDTDLHNPDYLDKFHTMINDFIDDYPEYFKNKV